MKDCVFSEGDMRCQNPRRTTACSRLLPASARASLPLPAAAEAQRSAPKAQRKKPGVNSP